MKCIRIRGLTFKYSGCEWYALKNVSLDVEEGEFILVSGPSGGGKTTLARTIVGLIPHFYHGVYNGEVYVYDMLVSKTPIFEISRYVGYLFQNPENQIFMTTVERDIAFGLEFRGFNRDEMRERVRRVLKILNIEHLAGRRIDELSGGEKQKVALAGVLALNPKIIILDEPTAYLAPKSALELMRFLKKLNEEYNTTIILIDHRLDLASQVASRLIIVSEGEIVLDKPIREGFSEIVYKRYGVNVPTLVRIYEKVRRYGVFKHPPLSVDEFTSILKMYLKR